MIKFWEEVRLQRPDGLQRESAAPVKAPSPSRAATKTRCNYPIINSCGGHEASGWEEG